jgi:hypothetical protein
MSGISIFDGDACAPLARWPEDGPSLTAAVRDGTSSAQVGAEGWSPIEQKDGLPMPLPARCIAFGKRKDPDSCTTITVTKEISFRSISLRPSDCARAIQRHDFKTRLLPLDQKRRQRHEGSAPYLRPRADSRRGTAPASRSSQPPQPRRAALKSSWSISEA